MHGAGDTVRRGFWLVSVAALACGGAGEGRSTVHASIEPAADATAAPGAPPASSAGCFDAPVTVAEEFRGQELAGDPDASPCPWEMRPTQCRFAVARQWLEARRWEKAGPIFLDVALDPTAGNEAMHAARLGLGAMNVLGMHAEPPRAACYEEMRILVPQLLRALCVPLAAADAEETCTILLRILVDIGRLEAEAWTKEADYGAPNRQRLYERAGDRYVGLARTHCPPGRPAPYAHCDEIFYNAYRSYKAARAIDKANAVRAALLDPRNGLEESPFAESVAKEPPLPRP
jgi:hypothetical protein